MRVGFIGASGTGKSTLVRLLQVKHPDVPVNPVGSRSVAKAMGFVHPAGSPQADEGNPYAVDHASESIYLGALAISNDPLIAAHTARFVAPDASRSPLAPHQLKTCRPLFQARLQAEKIAWEAQADAFLTDRTPLDDLAYAILHCREVVDDAFIDRAFAAMSRYNVVFYCPLATFCNLDGDASRVAERAYHRIHDAILAGLIEQHERPDGSLIQALRDPSLAARQEIVSWFVQP